MRRRASPLHALLVPAPPPGALRGVATGAASYIRPHGPVVRTLPRVVPCLRIARSEATNGRHRRVGNALEAESTSTRRKESRMHRHVPGPAARMRTFAPLAALVAAGLAVPAGPHAVGSDPAAPHSASSDPAASSHPAAP